MKKTEKNSAEKSGRADDNILHLVELIESRVDAAVREIRRHVAYWMIFVSSVVGVSAYWGFPQLREFVLNKMTTEFMQKEIAGRLSALQHEVDVYSNLYAKASLDLQLVQLQTDAELGSVAALNELCRRASESDFARRLCNVVTSRQVALLSNYTQHHCMNEMGLGYNRREEWSEAKMFGIILNENSADYDFSDAMKNLVVRHEKGDYLDFFVWYVEQAKNLNRLRIAVDCIRYVTTAPKTVSAADISRWWESNKKPEWCHGIAAKNVALKTGSNNKLNRVQ